MSDSEDSTVTYTTVPPSPDYVYGPEEPEQEPPLPEFIPEPVYPEYMPPEDEDPADYPTDGGDDDDDDDDESSDNDADDDDDESSDNDADDDDDVKKDEDEDEEEEEEHPASVDSILPPPVHHVTTRMSIIEKPPTLFWSELEIDRLLTIPSPLSPWSSPLPRIHLPLLSVSLPLPVSSPPLPASPTIPLGYRAAIIWLRAETPSTSHPLSSSTLPSGTPPLQPIPLPTSSPPMLLPSTSHKVDVPKVTLPPRKRLCIALGPRYEVGGVLQLQLLDLLEDEMLVGMPGARATDEAELGWWVTNFVTTVRHDTNKIYVRLDDAQDDRALISGRVNMLYKNKRDHARTARLMETEAKLSRQAWVQSMDANDLAPCDADRSRNSEDSHDSRIGVRRQAPPAHECTYQDFMKCKSLYFKGTKGFVKLTQWFKRMETVFSISNCTVENQIKFATCTLLRSALTWWNSHVTTVGPDVAYAMTWTNLRKKMTDKYCPRGEIKKLEGGRIPTGLTLQGLVIRNLTEVLNLYALNAIITMMVSVLQNAISETGLAIWLGTVGVLQVPILLTTKGALRQFRNLHALSVETMDISRGSVQS
uniref:Reverse transcriptase domain-containing protein n=1 Tax=Tanacetum cinerariifolium TaxID=118510 RepID=A0A699HAV9_TANCI|nr:hypothetical protein [Tanacetum cinerariifolium]